MCLRKEFLLFFTAVIYMGLLVDIVQPIPPRDLRILNMSLNNLKMAENQCVHQLFGEEPNAYSADTLEPLVGITFPVGNTTDPKTQETMFAINDYLECHLPKIIKTVVLNASEILSNTKAFQIQFKAFAEKTFSTETKCNDEKLEKLGDYAKKIFVLRIIYFSRKWTEAFIS